MRTHFTSEETSGLFHACTACGGSCQGVIISMINDQEAQRIERLADELGVPNALSAGQLQRVDGRCVFLRKDNLCQIQKKFGMAAKPTVCKQFPMVAIRAEEGLRIGVDPACYSAFSGMTDGPPVGSGSLVATSSRLDERQLEFERQILTLCEVDGVRLSTLASWLAGEKPSPDGLLPVGFETRVVAQAIASGLAPWVQENPVGRAIVANLLPVLTFAEEGADSCLGQLDADADAWAVEAIRRVLFLRLIGEVPTVPGTALLLVAGAILCGRAKPTAADFAPAFSGWIRAIRFQQFWTRFTPDSATMRRLLKA